MKLISNPMAGGTGRCGGLSIYHTKDGIIARGPRTYCSERQRNQLRARGIAMVNINHLWNSFPKPFTPVFQPLPPRRNCFNIFASLATKTTPVYLEKGDRSAIVAPVAVSGGTLPAIAARLEAGVAVTDIALGDLPVDGRTTVEQLAEAVVERNPLFAFGDSLLCYKALQTDDGTMRQAVITCEELTLACVDSRPLGEALGDLTGFANQHGCLGAREAVVGGMAWVHLRPTAHGTVLRSTQHLVVDNPCLATYSSAEQHRRAIASRVTDKRHLEEILFNLDLTEK